MAEATTEAPSKARRNISSANVVSNQMQKTIVVGHAKEGASAL